MSTAIGLRVNTYCTSNPLVLPNQNSSASPSSSSSSNLLLAIDSGSSPDWLKYNFLPYKLIGSLDCDCCCRGGVYQVGRIQSERSWPLMSGLALLKFLPIEVLLFSNSSIADLISIAHFSNFDYRNIYTSKGKTGCRFCCWLTYGLLTKNNNRVSNVSRKSSIVAILEGNHIFPWGIATYKASKARLMDAVSPWRPQIWVYHAGNNFATLSPMFKRPSRTSFDSLINFPRSCKSLSSLFVLAASPAPTSYSSSSVSNINLRSILNHLTDRLDSYCSSLLIMLALLMLSPLHVQKQC